MLVQEYFLRGRGHRSFLYDNSFTLSEHRRSSKLYNVRVMGRLFSVLVVKRTLATYNHAQLRISCIFGLYLSFLYKIQGFETGCVHHQVCLKVRNLIRRIHYREIVSITEPMTKTSSFPNSVFYITKSRQQIMYVST